MGDYLFLFDNIKYNYSLSLSPLLLYVSAFGLKSLVSTTSQSLPVLIGISPLPNNELPLIVLIFTP
ncbi:hypothetical protein, partial [Enterobacter hormaechei]|uniref:hypothetical protein n=1 Tax=Enterobacter hormaechei TaxID=158836 RepID=UPI0019CFE0AE